MADAKANGSKPNSRPKEPALARRGGGRWLPRESYRNVFALVVDSDVTDEDIQRPDFWSTVSREMKRRDTVEIFSDDGRRFSEWYVVDAGLGWAQVHLLRAHELPAVEGTDPDKLAGFRFERDGVSGDWFAIREKDGAVLGKHDQLKSLQAAKRHVEDHATTNRR